MWKLSFNPRKLARNAFQRFLKKNLPPNQQVKLTQKRLFILPSASGCFFVVVILLVWLLGTNYENNLALALAYLLAALFIISIHHTFNNLHRIELKFYQANAVFVSEQAKVQIIIAPGKVTRVALELQFDGGSRVRQTVGRDQEEYVSLFVPVERRGWYDPGRLTIKSVYPLGLFRCWSQVDLDIKIMAYPKPIVTPALPFSDNSAQDGQMHPTAGSEDFHSLREYLLGDSLKHVAWKHYARGQGLLTKNYNAFLDTRVWLDWDLLAGQDQEIRLSRLAYLAVEAEKHREDYGLRLPGIELPPNHGPQHLTAVLTALALFGVASPAQPLTAQAA